MTEVFLGIIAAAVLVMAVIQVAAVLLAVRAVRRVGRLADRLEQDIRPMLTNLQALTADLARVTALATAQVDRADRLFNQLAHRVERTLAAVQHLLLAPVREGLAWLDYLKAILAAMRDDKGAPRQRPARVEDDDALFIG